ncbi:Uncharacterised protein g4161 [Pycnogonum litorale]
MSLKFILIVALISGVSADGYGYGGTDHYRDPYHSYGSYGGGKDRYRPSRYMDDDLLGLLLLLGLPFLIIALLTVLPALLAPLLLPLAATTLTVPTGRRRRRNVESGLSIAKILETLQGIGNLLNEMNIEPNFPRDNDVNSIESMEPKLKELISAGRINRTERCAERMACEGNNSQELLNKTYKNHLLKFTKSLILNPKTLPSVRRNLMEASNEGKKLSKCEKYKCKYFQPKANGFTTTT